jgi:glycosyltransferase involved in cell wall biosynthesis
MTFSLPIISAGFDRRLIVTLANRARDGAGVRTLIVGEALFTDEDRAYSKELQVLAADLGLADRIRFAEFRSDIFPLLLSVDLVVNCSTAQKSFGRVTVEAMLAGRPFLAP